MNRCATWFPAGARPGFSQPPAKCCAVPFNNVFPFPGEFCRKNRAVPHRPPAGPRTGPVGCPAGILRILYGLTVRRKRIDNWEQPDQHSGAAPARLVKKCPGARGLTLYENCENMSVFTRRTDPGGDIFSTGWERHLFVLVTWIENNYQVFDFTYSF